MAPDFNSYQRQYIFIVLPNDYFCLLIYRSVANFLSEIDQQDGTDVTELGDDIEMASIAEEEDLDEKFSHQGTSTGKHSGKKKVVRYSTKIR